MPNEEKEKLIYAAFEVGMRGRIAKEILIPLDKTVKDWNDLLTTTDWKSKTDGEQDKELMRAFLAKLLQARQILEEMSL